MSEANHWMKLFEFRFHGTPYGQPRARARVKRFGNRVVAGVHDDLTHPAFAWKEAITLGLIKQLPKGHKPIEGPVCVETNFIFPRPKSLMRRKDPTGRIWHTPKPDRDNCEKLLLDAFTAYGVWQDDAQVCDGAPRKFYAAIGEGAGAEVIVSVLSDSILTTTSALDSIFATQTLGETR